MILSFPNKILVVLSDAANLNPLLSTKYRILYGSLLHCFGFDTFLCSHVEGQVEETSQDKDVILMSR